MANYIQESEWGGRKGGFVNADVFLGWSDYGDLMTVPEKEDELALQRYLRGHVCRNKTLMEYLNGPELAKDCRKAESFLFSWLSFSPWSHYLASGWL